MRFTLTATVDHLSFDKPVVHKYTDTADSSSEYFKRLNFAPKNICDLKNTGETSYTDHRGVTHHLKVEVEAN